VRVVPTVPRAGDSTRELSGAQGGPATGSVVSIAITGMTCGACAARIEYRLNKLDAVSASVNYASQRARATIGAGVAPRRLVEEIESIGYGAALVSEPASSAGGPSDAVARARSLGWRLLVAALLFMPLCDLSIVFWAIPAARIPGWEWLLLALGAPVVSWAAWPFYATAWRGARHGTFTMDTLASLGILASTACSAYSLFRRDAYPSHRTILFLLSHQVSGASYLDVAAGVTTFLLAGRYFEATTRRHTGDALASLASLVAKEVAVLDDDGVEVRRPAGALAVGTRFVVRPGEAVATDGQVVAGRSAIDRSAVTGESMPVEVGPGDDVVGGTVSVGGRLVVRATRVGEDTQLAAMMRLVEAAQNEKAEVQRLADRVSGVFVPCVVAAAAATLLGWLVAGGGNAQALNGALSVLIVACPCALGLATPAALLFASGAGARNGVFFKGYRGLEASRRVDTVVLDKTGTVTSGSLALTEVVAGDGVEAASLLRWAGAVEQASEHPIARAVLQAALGELGELPTVEAFAAQPGLGATGVVEGHVIALGRSAVLGAGSEVAPELAARCGELEAHGCTTVLLACDGVVAGALAFADTVRPSAPGALRRMHELGLRCILLTGDNESTARAVGEEIGADEVIAGALPADKVAVIHRLRAAGRTVAMVGDGVNDAAALAAADLGIAVGSGTDVAINAADLIVVRDDLGAVVAAVVLARRTIATIRSNLAWAFGYNLAALPIAACGLLNPLVAGAAMAASSAFVLWNSARLAGDPGPAGGAPLRRRGRRAGWRWATSS
jgi:Cu+-exporting ATPase